MKFYYFALMEVNKAFGCDQFEARAFTLFENKINKYYGFWHKFIGNNGQSFPLPIEGINESHNRLRLQMGQYNYTILKDIVFMKEALIAYENNENSDKIDFVSFEHSYIMSIHSFYNIIELVDGINNNKSFNASKIKIEQFLSFKKYRNEIAHTMRSPFKIKENQVFVPTNFNNIPNDPNLKEDPKIWSLKDFDTHLLDYQPFQVFITQYIENGFSLLNSIIALFESELNKIDFFKNGAQLNWNLNQLPSLGINNKNGNSRLNRGHPSGSNYLEEDTYNSFYSPNDIS